MDLDADDAGRVVRHLGSGLTDGLGHLLEDVKPSLAGLIERLLHDLAGDAVDLDVHLQRRDAVAGAGNLEVHVSEMVLVAHDVREHHELVTLLDEAHGDTGDRRLDGHARVHQRHARAANARHGARPVGLGNFRDHPHDVGKLLGQVRHDRHDTALGETAMADLAPLRRSDSAGLADAERREVVMHHEGLAPLALDGIDDLSVAAGAERRDHQRLGLAAGEQRRAVGARQHADAGGDVTHRGRIAAVDASLAGEYPAAHDLLLQTREGRDDLALLPLAVLATGEVLDDLAAHIEDLFLPLELLRHTVRFADRVGGYLGNAIGQRRVVRLRRPAPFGMPRLRLELANETDDGLHLLVAVKHGVEHDALAESIGFRLDHQHRVLGAGDNQIERRLLELREGGIQDELAVDVADPRRTDGPVERHARERHRRRGADHGRDVRVDLGIQ